MSTRSRSYHLRSDCDGECDLPENPQLVSRQLRRSAPPVKSTAVRPRSRKTRSHSLASRRHGPKTMKKKVIGKKKKIVRSYRSKSRSKAIHRRRPTRRKAAPRPKSKSSRRSRSVSFAPSSPNSDSRTASFSRSASPDSARRSQKSDSPSDRSRSRSRSRSSSTSSSRSAITGSYSTGSPERLMDLLEDINHTVQALNEENEKSFLSISKTKSHNPVTSSSTFSPMSVTGSSTSSSSSTSSAGLLGHLTELNNILEELQDSENDRSVDVGDLSTDFYEKIEELEPKNYADNGVTKIVIDSKLKAKSTCTLTLEEKNGERLLVVDEQIIVCPMEFQSGLHMQRHTLQMKKNKFLLNHHFFSNQQEVDDCLWSLQYSDRVLFYRRLSKLSLAGRESVHHIVSPANSIAPVSFGPDSGRLFAEDLYYSRRLPNSFARTGVTVLSFEAQSRSQGQTDALRQAMWKPEESGGHPKPIYREESVKLVGKELILETRWELKEELWQQPMDWKDRTVKSYELCPYFLHEK